MCVSYGAGIVASMHNNKFCIVCSCNWLCHSLHIYCWFVAHRSAVDISLQIVKIKSLLFYSRHIGLTIRLLSQPNPTPTQQQLILTRLRLDSIITPNPPTHPTPPTQTIHGSCSSSSDCLAPAWHQPMWGWHQTVWGTSHRRIQTGTGGYEWVCAGTSVNKLVSCQSV